MPRIASEQTDSKIMSYVVSFNDANGYSPSYREIGKAVGLKSTSTVYGHIKHLRDEGKLNLSERQCRTVSTCRRLTIPCAEQGEIHRIRLDTEDGGSLYVDCNVSQPDGRNITISFTGMLDASGLKSGVGRVVSCQCEKRGQEISREGEI